MLGIRLPEEAERMLESHARSLGRGKSVVAREWILERLERESVDAQMRSAAQLIAAHERQHPEEWAWHAAAADEALRALEESDGGYDWGPGGSSRLTRGDLVLARHPNSPASKPRPCVVVQRTSTIEGSDKVTLCPLSSTLIGVAAQRPSVAPSPENGLQRHSEVEADWMFTFPKSSIGPTIGRLDDVTLRELDAALRRWLHL